MAEQLHYEVCAMKPADTRIGRQVAASGFRLAIDEDCPSCGWGERWFDGKVFGCNKCEHTGEYRDA